MQAQAAVRLSRRSIVGFIITTLVTAALLLLLFVRLLSASHSASVPFNSPVVGHAAPAFSVTVWNGRPGETVNLAQFKGRPVVVNFWASWCEPCQEEAPVLAAAAKKYAGQGVVFLGIAYQDTQSDGATFLRQQGVSYLAGPDSTGAISVAYGVTGVPETVFINRSGTVTFKFGGAIDDGTLDQQIQALLRSHAA